MIKLFKLPLLCIKDSDIKILMQNYPGLIVDDFGPLFCIINQSRHGGTKVLPLTTFKIALKIISHRLRLINPLIPGFHFLDIFPFSCQEEGVPLNEFFR